MAIQNKRLKTRKTLKKRDNQLRLFLFLCFIYFVLTIVAVNLSRYTDADLTVRQMERLSEPAPVPTTIDTNLLTPQNQVNHFAAEYGILPYPLRFNAGVNFTDVNIPVNSARADLYYTNFKLTQFLTSHGWQQLSGTETANQDRQVLTFATPTKDQTYRFRIYYAPKGVYPEPKKQVAIVVKGFGNLSPAELSRWLDLDKNLCYSVLPIPNNTSRLNMQSIVEHHFEALIEIPMEAPGFPVVNIPDYAIFGHFKDSEVIAKLNQYFRHLPNASGTITHLGGLITTDHRIMPIILQYIKDRGLYFIDDKDIETSIAYTLAQQMMITSFEKTITLSPARYKNDNGNANLTTTIKNIDKEQIIITLHKPDDDTYDLVKRLLNILNRNDFEIVKVSEM